MSGVPSSGCSNDINSGTSVLTSISYSDYFMSNLFPSYQVSLAKFLAQAGLANHVHGPLSSICNLTTSQASPPDTTSLMKTLFTANCFHPNASVAQPAIPTQCNSSNYPMPSVAPVAPSNSMNDVITNAFFSRPSNVQAPLPQHALHDPVEGGVVSAGLPICYNVDFRTKIAIWQDHFIDLSILNPLKSPAHAAGRSDQGQLTYDRYKKFVKTIQDCNRAFLAYIAIYTQHPFKPPELKRQENSDLFTYMNEINLIAEEGGNFKAYNGKFRSDRSHLLVPCAWNTFRAGLYAEATGKTPH